MATGLVTTVTNAATHKKYFVSTIEGVAGWQTGVFRKRFGPFANFRKPELFIGGSAGDRAADQHDRVVAIVQDVDPADWEETSRKLQVQVINEWAAAEEAEHTTFCNELVRRTRSAPE
jgi:DNA-binding FadR family transcriptional regulator